MAQNSEKITFEGAQGQDLAGRFDLPQGKPRGVALFAHCFTCSKDTLAAARISSALAARGFAVLRFDFTGLGGSQGDFANTNFSSNVEDLVAAANYLRDTRGAPEILIGHSFGGTAMLRAAGQIPDAVCVATVGAPFDPAHVSHLFRDRIEDIEREGSAEVSIGGRPFTVRKSFIEDVKAQRLTQAIGNLRRPLLIFHAPLDQTVGIENAGEIFAAAKHPKSFVSLDTADHLLSKRRDAAYVGDVIAAWAARYLDDAESAAQPLDECETGQVCVVETGQGRLAQTINAGGHVLSTDEPASLGGTDTGPTPYDLLLASLGACTSMTLRMYAARKRWPLEKVRVRLRHEKIHSDDCEDCETTNARIDRIERSVEMTGALTAEQRERLLEIADKCPVHRTLHAEVLVETSLAEPA